MAAGKKGGSGSTPGSTKMPSGKGGVPTKGGK